MIKKLICFDLDNTLIKSNKAHVMAFALAFKKNNLKKIPLKKIESMLNGRPAHAVVKLLHPGLNNKMTGNVVNDHHGFIVKTAKHAKKVGNVTQTIKELRKHYSIAIATNCMHEEINALLMACGLDKELFDFIIGKEDVKHGKPNPDEIFKAEYYAGLNADFMVGDSIYDIMAAKKAGVKSISVLTGIAKKKELLKYKPDFVLKDVNQVPKLLDNIKKKIIKEVL